MTHEILELRNNEKLLQVKLETEEKSFNKLEKDKTYLNNEIVRLRQETYANCEKTNT